MKIVLATGIYPPEIGGVATYVEALAKELMKTDQVEIIAYGQGSDGVHWVSKSGPIIRWFRYAKVLREVAKDADVVYAFSSISAGVPVILSRVKGPKCLLRLGGDFFWERYTDQGGKKSLHEWYASKPFLIGLMGWILRQFDMIIFSTKFQQDLYEKYYRSLPTHRVIENAIPSSGRSPVLHTKHDPLRLLFVGRLVGFKNVAELIHALPNVNATLTIAGDGPDRRHLEQIARQGKASVQFVGSRTGEEKWKLFAEHDLLVIPSVTEMSPNVALEARSVGLPVLLTSETGLSSMLTQGMVLRDLRTAEAIGKAITEISMSFDTIASGAATPPPARNWESVAKDHHAIFS